jgi:hypothetical protein
MNRHPVLPDWEDRFSKDTSLLQKRRAARSSRHDPFVEGDFGVRRKNPGLLKPAKTSVKLLRALT